MGKCISYIINMIEIRYAQRRACVEVIYHVPIKIPWIKRRLIIYSKDRWRIHIGTMGKQISFFLLEWSVYSQPLFHFHAKRMKGNKHLEPTTGNEFIGDQEVWRILCNGVIDDFMDALNGDNLIWSSQVVDSWDE